MTTRKIAIIQARMSSSRLPAKVMQDIAGKPMLLHVIERARRASLINQVVLATTTDPSDDVLEQFCHKLGLYCYRGSLPDVLERFYQVAVQLKAELIIRLTADCPLLDPDILDRTVLAFYGHPAAIHTSSSIPITNQSSLITGPYDFSASRLPPPWSRTLPIGLDVEVCSFQALERAWHEASQLYQREHVMPYLYDGVQFDETSLPAKQEWYLRHATTPHGFRVAQLNHLPNYGALRWTVDTAADLEFVRSIYDQFDAQEYFSWTDVLALLEQKPELARINAAVPHKSAFDVDKRSLTY